MPRKIIGHGLAFLLGLLPGFFLVFASVFSDGGSPGEREFTFVLVFSAYLLLGMGLGYVWPAIRIHLSLVSTAILILVAYTISDSLGQPALILRNAAYGVVTVIASFLGVRAGQRLVEKRQTSAAAE